MTYLVGYERNGERKFVTKRSIHGNDVCRMFSSKKEAEMTRLEIAIEPGVTDTFVLTFGR